MDQAERTIPSKETGKITIYARKEERHGLPEQGTIMGFSLTRRGLLATAAVFSGTIASAGLLDVSPARAATWKPDRPVQVVVQYAAGGGTDTAVRAVMKEAEKILGQRIIVTNMTGAVGSVALQHALNQPADGYT